MQEAARAQEVDVGEGAEEEQPFDAPGEADQVEQELPALVAPVEALQPRGRVEPLQAEAGLLLDGGDVLHGGERLGARVGIRDVGVEQRQVELHVQGLFVELARQVHARLGGVQVPVEVQHQVVGHDRIASGEEGDQPLHEVALGVGHLAGQVPDVGREVDLLDGPGVLDRRPVHLEEGRVGHRPQREAEARIEQPGRTGEGAHWQASQLPGFSSEQATAAASVAAAVSAIVVLAILVAGRERR